MNKVKQLNLALSAEFLDKFKGACYTQGFTQREVVIKLIQMFVNGEVTIKKGE